MKSLPLLLLILFSCQLHAQQFGGTPANIHWRQINTDTARIIYPEDLDSIAQRVAALTHLEQRKYTGNIGNHIQKINIILRNELTYFNGYVGLGPYRSEYYLLPQQNAFELGAQSSADLLAVHEYRHVEQYSNFRKGLSKAAYVLFGQNGQALANNAAVPNWFFEGDAVYNETRLSQQGRGRLPYFFNGYHALYMDGRKYSFMKLRNGSYKDFVPDHYPLGYMLVAYGREKYGDDIWKKITGDAVRFRPLIYPWQGALKRYTGIPYRQFVKEGMAYYQRKWQEEEKPTVSWITPVQNNNVVDYKYPYVDADGSYIVLKNSYKTVPAFYRINANGKQYRIAAQSITDDDYFSFNNNTIVYAAYQSNARWGYREYSVIRMMDAATGKEHTITTHTRYFSPDISHNGKWIAAVSVTPEQHSTLDVLNVQGKKLFSFTNNNNEVYSYPKFAADDQSVYVMLRKTDGQMSLQQFSLQTKESTVILPFANRILGYPTVQGDTILYTASGKGSDDVWAYVPAEKKKYHVAAYPTGLYQSVLGKDGGLVSSAFTSGGYRLGTLHPQWQIVPADADTLTTLYLQAPFTPPSGNILHSVPEGHYPASSYSKLSHPFNFHSWQPDYSDPLFTFTVYGENVLGTLQNQLYYAYNTNEKYNEVGYNLTYGGWYVEPYLSIDETFGRKQYDDLTNSTATWNEFNAGAGVQLPLNFSGGKSYRYLTTTASFNVISRQYTGESKTAFSNDHHNIVEGSLTYVSQKQSALQHIYPHWAQTLLVQYRTLAESRKAYQLLLSGAVYLPGILPSHSLVLNAAYQTRDTLSNYRFANDFPFSRGYDLIEDRRYPNTIKLGANYHFPLLYPDFGIGNIVYFKRIRAKIFFDYTQLRTNNPKLYQPSFNFNSAGAEIYFDTRWWNEQNITVGIRYSHLLDAKYTSLQPNQWEIILPGSIFY